MSILTNLRKTLPNDYGENQAKDINMMVAYYP